MDMLLGLTAPKIKEGIEDGPVKDSLMTIYRFLDEVLLKSKKFGGETITVTVVTDVRTDSGQVQKKTRVMVIKDGMIEDMCNESNWTNAGAT